MITQGMIALLILTAIGIGIAFAVDSDYASKRFKQMTCKHDYEFVPAGEKSCVLVKQCRKCGKSDLVLR